MLEEIDARGGRCDITRAANQRDDTVSDPGQSCKFVEGFSRARNSLFI